MEPYTLVLYGSQNLTNNKSLTSNAPGASTAQFIVQRLPNARTQGSTVVNERVNEKIISANGTLCAPGGSSTLTLSDVIEEYDDALHVPDQYLAFRREWMCVFLLDSTTGFAVGNDAVNLGSSNDKYQYGTGALTFDVDVSASGVDIASITGTGLPSTDLSSVSLTGNLETWVFIPEVAEIESLSFTFGSSGSDFYKIAGITTDYQGDAFQNGWNYLSAKWEDFLVTGTPDDSDITVYNVDIGYSSAQTDDVGFAVDALIWQNDSQSRNYRSYIQNYRKGDNHFNATFTSFDAQFVVQRGTGEATNTETIISDTAVTTETNSHDLDFIGSAEPGPVFNFTLNDVTDLTSITLANQRNETSVTLTETWADNDILVVDLDQKEVTLNAVQVDYDGTLPTFLTNRNRTNVSVSGSGGETIEQLTQDADLNSLNELYAQSFTPTVSGTVTSIEIFIKKIGTVLGGNIVPVNIYSDTAGDPNVTVAVFTGIISASVGTSYAFYNSPGSFAVTATTKYWVVLGKDTALNELYLNGSPGVFGASQNLSWGYNTAGGLAGEEIKRKPDGGAWTAVTGDATFKVNIENFTSLDYDLTTTYKPRYL